MNDRNRPTRTSILAAEAAGTLMLVLAVVGSGIMASRLTHDEPALALLCNAIATGGMLFCIIVMWAPVSGAHFNPAVSLVECLDGKMAANEFIARVTAQCVGGAAGTLLAHPMFGVPLWLPSTTVRSGGRQLLGEFVATFGLVLLIRRLSGRSSHVVAAAVALYIVGAYWFTSSTSFANPAVTIARALTDTYAGIRPRDVLGFIPAQITGALAAYLFARCFRTEPMPDDSEFLGNARVNDEPSE